MAFRKTAFIIVLFDLAGFAFSLDENGTYQQMMEMVIRSIRESNSYVLPTDNSDLLQIKDDNTQNYGSFDFIVIGSGAAGAVVASRLSEISDWSVLVLEAGGNPGDFIKIVGLSSYAYTSNYNWGYNSTVQQNACLAMKTKQCYMPHGKAFGGTTAINGAVYSRGHPEDYAHYAELSGDDAWSYENVFPYFIKSENAVFEPRNHCSHGVGGLLTVDLASQIPRLTGLIKNSFEELGYKDVDMNSPIMVGKSLPPFTLVGNERLTTARAFLEPFLGLRSNLNISLNSFVTKVLIDNNTKVVTGVEFVKDRRKYVANANREVIVSAGAYNSPQLLMLSGVGPKEHLQELDIPVIEDLPVGRNLREQIVLTAFVLRQATPIYDTNFSLLMQNYASHLQPLVNPWDLIAFTNFEGNQSHQPTIEFMVSYMPLGNPRVSDLIDEYRNANAINTSTDASLTVILLHPRSTGSVTLKSSNPIDQPILDPNFLSDVRDLETMYRGVQELLRLNATSAFKDSGAQVIVFDSPNCASSTKLSKEWWYCNIKQRTIGASHPVSTNQIGTDPSNSVVNSRLLVHGLKNLRIADASVIPATPSGHTMVPTIMVGEKAGDLIKQDHGQLN